MVSGLLFLSVRCSPILGWSSRRGCSAAKTSKRLTHQHERRSKCRIRSCPPASGPAWQQDPRRGCLDQRRWPEQVVTLIQNAALHRIKSQARKIQRESISLICYRTLTWHSSALIEHPRENDEKPLKLNRVKNHTTNTLQNRAQEALSISTTLV